MNYKETKASGFLNEFVECFWEYKNVGKEIKHTILPNGFFELILEYESCILKRVYVKGICTQAVNVKVPKDGHILAVRFKILASEYIFQKELIEILNTTKELPLDFWQLNVFRCHEFNLFVEKLTLQFMHQLKSVLPIDQRKVKLFHLVYQYDCKCVKELSEEVAWSSRQINRYFNTQFGFSLKELLKIIRFRFAYTHISKGVLYPSKGYFDQAHFIREIKRYSGVTPRVLYKNEKDRFLQLSTVDH